MATTNFGKNQIYDVISNILIYNVSDIHILEDKPLYIRNALGDIKPVNDTVLSKEEIRGFMHDFLDTESIEKLLEGIEIDTSYTIKNIRFRINAYKDRNGIRLALRKISAEPPSMEEIGLIDDIKKYLLKDKGLILVTGPTGSGKSTTMAAMLDYINQEKANHIITLEDPIEYLYTCKQSLVTQREIGKNSQSWKTAIKYALRQDPDVIMVGEMRDIESISSVLTLVETGHLVLSTLHTIDASSTISRIIDVFPPYQQEQIAVQLSLTLSLILSQRLLPIKEGKGRVAAREILINNSAIANNIKERKISQIHSILETGFRYGMKTMDQSLAELVLQGFVELDIVLPKVKNLEGFKALLKGLDDKRTFKPMD